MEHRSSSNSADPSEVLKTLPEFIKFQNQKEGILTSKRQQCLEHTIMSVVSQSSTFIITLANL